MASASGSGSEELVLARARQLLGASGDILKIMDTLRALVADSDLLEKSQRLYDTADGQKEETGHSGTAFLAGRPYSQAAWAASLTSTGAFDQAS